MNTKTQKERKTKIWRQLWESKNVEQRMRWKINRILPEQQNNDRRDSVQTQKVVLYTRNLGP